jgi:hypothetical protein
MLDWDVVRDPARKEIRLYLMTNEPGRHWECYTVGKQGRLIGHEQHVPQVARPLLVLPWDPELLGRLGAALAAEGYSPPDRGELAGRLRAQSQHLADLRALLFHQTGLPLPPPEASPQ